MAHAFVCKNDLYAPDEQTHLVWGQQNANFSLFPTHHTDFKPRVLAAKHELATGHTQELVTQMNVSML